MFQKSESDLKEVAATAAAAAPAAAPAASAEAAEEDGDDQPQGEPHIQETQVHKKRFGVFLN
jgi:ribosomal protein L12E/L44/L45/RPP1/RPP2